MPYARRDQLTWQRGGYYHLYNRGAHRLPIFRAPENYLFALERIRRYSQAFQISVIAYCLLPNHYHLLVRQDGDSRAGLLPQRVFNSYTKAYNRRYGHSGTLFEHRFQARQITREAHLLHLCVYIHANPVKHGLVDDPADWPYSNYHEWVGRRAGKLVDRGFIREMFPGGAEAYRRQVQAYLRSRRLPQGLEAWLAEVE